MNPFKKKVFSRYYKNQTFLSILFSISSSSKTLNPSSIFPLYTTFNAKQLHTRPRFCNLSSGPHSDCSVSHSIHGFASDCHFSFLSIGLLRHHFGFRFFCKLVKDVDSDKIGEFEEMGDDIFGDLEKKVSSGEGVKSQVNNKHVSEITEAVRSGGSDLGLLLDSRSINLSVRLVVEIFRVLNYDRIPALRFFKWLEVRYPKLCYSSRVCSLMICNCGWLEDYETMIVMLKEFRVKRVCLDEKAFEFLPVLTSSQASSMDSIRRVINAFIEVGGSCCGSGICSLIKMLCSLDSFELAEFVIEITGKKVSHYNIIIVEKCRKCLVREVHGLLEEMRGFGCDPNISTYNYLLSNLCTTGRMSEACRLVKSMQESGTTPDALSFDILIQYACKAGKLDIAHQFYNQIIHRGIKPRIQTHVAFVKSYFSAGNFHEALKYVHDLDDQHLQSSNMLYSLVAYLHLKKGHLIVAQSILIQMMDKGLKPNFLIFIKVVKRLQKSCKGSLARDLRSRFSRFTV